MGYVIKDKKWCMFYDKTIKDVGKHWIGDVDEARHFGSKKDAQSFLENNFNNFRCCKNLQIIRHTITKERN